MSVPSRPAARNFGTDLITLLSSVMKAEEDKDQKEIDEAEAIFAEKMEEGYPAMGGVPRRHQTQTRPPRKVKKEDGKKQTYKARRRRPAP
jgi:hypothetical protein